MIENCPLDQGDLSAANRARIRNGLSEVFDLRFASAFSDYVSYTGRDVSVESLMYDPSRQATDPLIQTHAKGRYDRFVALETPKAPEGTDFHPLKAPVGEYGEAAAMALSAAGVNLVEHLAETSAQPLKADEGLLVNNHTYYGMARKFGDESFLANQQQGVAFTIHALAALTAQKVEGYATFPDLLRGISERYTTETLTKLVGSLAVTPLVEQGFFVERPLLGDLTVSVDLAEYANATRRRHREKARDARREFAALHYGVMHGEIDPDDVDWGEFRRLHQAGALGLSCPAADRGGSITMTVRSLSKAVDSLM